MGSYNSRCNDGIKVLYDVVTQHIDDMKSKISIKRVGSQNPLPIIDVFLRITKHGFPVEFKCAVNVPLGVEYRFSNQKDAKCVVEKVLEFYDKSPDSMDAHVIELITVNELGYVQETARTTVVFRCGNIFKVYEYNPHWDETGLKAVQKDRVKDPTGHTWEGYDVLRHVELELEAVFKDAKQEKEQYIVYTNSQRKKLKLGQDFSKCMLRLQSFHLNAPISNEMSRRSAKRKDWRKDIK